MKRPCARPLPGVLAATLWAACTPPGATEAAPANVAATAPPVFDALRRLQAYGELWCEPQLPFFCRNIHVACAGQTARPAFAFKLRLHAAARGSIDPAAAAGDEAREAFTGAALEWDPQAQWLLLQATGSPSYFKLRADGVYSLRHYVQQAGVSEGLMSLGRCR